MKLALVDQSFHRKTRSTLFIGDILSQLGQVALFFVDECNLIEVVDGNFDIVVLVQTEFCAPYFLAKGQRTIIVPMYDACASMPEAYWRAMTYARAICFCHKLHSRISECGLKSMYLQYFPNPSAIKVIEDFSDLRGFLWQRRPREGFNWRLGSQLCGSSLASLHIHRAADDGENGTETFPPSITSSEWSSGFFRLFVSHAIRQCFFCPTCDRGNRNGELGSNGSGDVCCGA